MEKPKGSSNLVHPSLPSLFLSFLRLGLTAFGGPAMVAYMRTMAVERKRWLDEETFRDGVALCQTIPGATSMQTTAYVGLKARGIAGAVLGFTGFVFPAFCGVTILSALYVHTHNLPVVVSAFGGLRAIIVSIIANAAISFGKSNLKGFKDIVITAIAGILFGLGTNPALVILLAALLGMLFYRRESFQGSGSCSGTTAPYPKTYLASLIAALTGYILLFCISRPFFQLATLMSKVDLLAFGGGYTSVPLMFHEVVNVYKWIDARIFMDGIVLGQVTPGPIVITATFVGYWLYGLSGSIIGTISVFLPSFLIVVGIVPYYDRVRGSAWFHRTMRGILSSFVGLLLSVTIHFGMNVQWNLFLILIAAAALVALLRRVEIIWVVLAGVILSIIALHR